MPKLVPADSGRPGAYLKAGPFSFRGGLGREDANRHRFPWRTGNRFELLVDGPAFFAHMLDRIDRARDSVLLELYLVESGAVASRFVDALCRASSRGVAVKLLLDDFGSRGLSRLDRRRLTAEGVDLLIYNDLRFTRWLGNLYRDHRKLLVVDGCTAYVGGAGVTDAFDPPMGKGPGWHDVMVAIEGSIVADWDTVFREGWLRHAERPLPPPIALPATSTHQQRGRVAASNHEIKSSVIRRVRLAKRRVWIATAYFLPSTRLRSALKRAARRGVDVRIILPGPKTDHPPVRHAGRRFYDRLLRHGVRIFEYQPRFLHAKIALCDDWVSVGSSNLDRWNLQWNLEANQEVDDGAFASSVQAMLERDLEESIEWIHLSWQARSWVHRAQESLWTFVARQLDRLGRK